MANILKPALVLFIICTVVTAALAFTYSGTKDVIVERARVEDENARKEVLPGVDRFEAIRNIAELSQGEGDKNIIEEAYCGLKGATVEGYVFKAVTKGYGGDIQIMIGIDSEGKIIDVKIGDHSETPGLGSKAAEEPFNSQLSGFAPQEPLSVVKGESAKQENIEAISGATITSKAVVKGVQAALNMWDELNKKEGIQ